MLKSGDMKNIKCEFEKAIAELQRWRQCTLTCLITHHRS